MQLQKGKKVGKRLAKTPTTKNKKKETRKLGKIILDPEKEKLYFLKSK